MKLAFATIGEAPRDDVVPYLRARLHPGVAIAEDGILNGLSEPERRALDSGGDALHMVTRARDGTAYRIDHELAVPRMQRVVDGLVAGGAELVVILCGADWSRVRADVPIVNPGRVFANTVQALAQDLRLGVIKPDAGQIPHTEAKWRALGVDAVVAAASPYVPERVALAREAAARLADAGVDLVWMSCIGMPETMRDAVREVLPQPVILARSLLGRLVGELTATPLPTVGRATRRPPAPTPEGTPA